MKYIKEFSVKNPFDNGDWIDEEQDQLEMNDIITLYNNNISDHIYYIKIYKDKVEEVINYIQSIGYILIDDFTKYVSDFLYLVLWSDKTYNLTTSLVEFNQISKNKTVIDDYGNIFNTEESLSKITKVNEYNDLDPFDEEDWDEDEGDTPFVDWLKLNYPDKTTWWNIHRINCSFNKFTSLEGIENLPNLEYLYCHNNNLVNLKGVQTLRKLKEIQCYNNRLETLVGVGDLPNLTEIRCHKNRLRNLHGLENLPHLNRLVCFENQIRTLDGLENSKYLYYLNISENNLRNLDGIENLKRLETLYCHVNFLTTLDGVEKISKLTNIYASHNEFSESYKFYIKNIKLRKHNLEL